MEQVEQDPYVAPLTPQPAPADPLAKYRPMSRAPRPLTPRRRQVIPGRGPVELHITASGRIYYTREPGTRY